MADFPTSPLKFLDETYRAKMGWDYRMVKIS